MKLKKILVISRSAWRDDNSTGNTLSNFFSNYPSDCIANLYVREESPQNTVCHNYFKISEKDLLKKTEGVQFSGIKENIFKKRDLTKNKTLRYFRSTVLLWIREFIWRVFNWKTEKLQNFVKDFSPDIIFMPVYDSIYMHNIGRYLADISHAKIVLFHADDKLSYRCFSLSPLFWINRYLQRKSVMDLALKAKLNYCISEEQINIYNSIFNSSIQFDILYKCVNNFEYFEYSTHLLNKKEYFKILYAGNLESGRDITILQFVKFIEKYNVASVKKIIFQVYTSSLDIIRYKNNEYISFNPPLSYENIKIEMKQADFLLHVESFKLKEKLSTSLSFSTKIVDYLEARKCIIAIGWEKAASISYILKYNCGYVISDIDDIPSIMNNILTDHDEYKKIIKNTNNVIIKNHNRDIVIKKFFNQIFSI